jgi:hypothetical protein
MLLWFLSFMPAPPIEAIWLPSADVCEARQAQAQEHLAWVAFQEWADKNTPAERLWVSHKVDAQWRVNVWYTARMYRLYQSIPQCVIEYREELRELLGDEAFYAGSLPYPVPIWRWLPR